MTLAGQHNHYRIKYLSGYAFALRSKDKRIVLRNGQDARSSQPESEEQYFITQLPYDKIVISGKGYIATETVRLLAKHNINLTLLDSYGNLVSNITKVMDSNIATKNRIGQYDTFRDAAKVRYIQNQIVKAKLQGNIRLLKEFGLETRGLESYLNQVDGMKDKRELLTIESRAGNIYFRQYVKMFDRKYGFVSRRGGGLVMSNKKAGDVINALLNYGYSVLASEINKFLNAYGFDSYCGFYHTADTSFQALTYDVIEPFRYLVEYATAKIAGETNHNKPIKKNEYTWTSEGAIVLGEGLIKRYLEMLSRTFESERPYLFNHGLKRKDGLSMCKEITIAKIAVENLVRFCTDKNTTWTI